MARFSDRLGTYRNRLLASGEFQRWAAKFPLTRPIAARRAKALFDISAGFVYSQTLFACSQLKLFHLLRDEARSLEWLAGQTGIRSLRLQALLTAATSLGLLERTEEGSFGLGRHGAAFLGNHALETMIEHHAVLYRDLADPVALLRSDSDQSALSAFWPYEAASAGEGGADGRVGPYSSIMDQTQVLIADDILDAYKFEHHRAIVDIGGGEGAFLRAVARRRADIALTLFDLPAVASRAERRMNEARLANPFTAVGGDFRSDPLPTGADLMSLVRIAHDHDDPVVDALFAKIFAALPGGGVLLVAEPMKGVAGVESVGAYFSLYLLAMGHGRPRSPQELEAMLRKAGFARIRHMKTARPIFCSLIIAQKSAGPGNRL